MALNEKLEKFMKQQAKCQFRLSSIAYPPMAKCAEISQMSHGKFSENTRLLQHINKIRNGSVGSQQKCVIGVLFETRQALTPEQINQACYVDTHANKTVFESLKKNPKVHYDGTRFSCKATNDVKNKSQLLSFVNKYPDGIDVIDLKDAYPSVMEDLQTLKASGDIWLLLNTDSKEGIAYPNEFKSQIQVDDDFKALFRDLDIPSDILDVEMELLKIGLKPATSTAARRAAAAQIHHISSNKLNLKKKKKEMSKRTKLTNAHLPELYKN